MNETTKQTKDDGKKSLIWMSVIYLFGLFIGAIDTGIVTPARPIIQGELGVDANLGIWMITIYTLTYAAIIPISGKLADKKGRKIVYLISIALFGTGSLICAFSASAGSFLVLMIGRVVQASGAGGIMPVATAEFSTSFPEEKRGMALGLVGAVYGIANVLGASVGSLVLNIAGNENWQWIFLINVPICIFIVISGIIVLPNNKFEGSKAMDKLGTLLMTLIILSLLYSLKNLDFFDFINSFKSTNVWPFLLISLILIPLFVLVEKKAEDPIFHIEYMSNRQILVTLILGLIVGCSMMGMIFIPQFAENSLKIPSGSGGYFVIILGFCSGAASMMSGKMIDKHGAKPVMAAGFITTIIGCLYLSLIAVNYINIINVIVSLILIGFGLGLTMGTPLNYMMLQNTSDEESNSALATLSLIRSIGTAVAPAIMVGFIVHASSGLQDGLMSILPTKIEVPEFTYAKEIDAAIEEMQANPEMASMMGDMEIPKLSDMSSMEMDMNMSASDNSSFEMPADLLDELQNSDVTTITDITVELVDRMYTEMTPTILDKITTGIDAGINGINAGVEGMESMLNAMPDMSQMGNSDMSNMDMDAMMDKASEMGMDMSNMDMANMDMDAMKDMMSSDASANDMDMNAMMDKAKEMGMDMSNMDMDAMKDMMSSDASANDATASDMDMGGMNMSQMPNLEELKNTVDKMKTLSSQLTSVKEELPVNFEAAGKNYAESVKNMKPEIQDLYQKTVNVGYKNMYLFQVGANALGLLFLCFYKEPKRKIEEVTE